MISTSEYQARSWADISDDGQYRYLLGRQWDQALPECVFIMLNPSTADASVDDPTIRRCIGFAKTLGCGSLLVGNLYAYRATSPSDLFKADEPMGGTRNDEVLTDLLGRGQHVIAGWGAHGRPDRVAEVLNLPGSDRLSALGVTKSGSPRHPLYIRGDTVPSPWMMTG